MPLSIVLLSALLTLLLSARSTIVCAISALNIFVLLFSSLPISSNWLLNKLETLHPNKVEYFNKEFALSQFETQPKYIVLLGGDIARLTQDHRQYTLGVSADRLVQTVKILKLFPTSKLILCAGGSRNDAGELEASILLLKHFGIDISRVIAETKSSTTYENAIESLKLMENSSTEIILVTSAYHMPRAMKVFTALGTKPIPISTDFQGTQSIKNKTHWIPSTASLKKTQIALHEYYGLIWYKLKGYY